MNPNQPPPAAPIDPHALADAFELAGALAIDLDLLETLIAPDSREAASVRRLRAVTRGLAVALAHTAGPALLAAIAADVAVPPPGGAA